MNTIKRIFKNGKVHQALFITLGLALFFLFNAIGSEVPTMKYDSQIMAMSELVRNDTITNITLDKVDDSEDVKSNSVNSIIKYFYQYKDRYRPYCTVEKTYSFELDDFICDAAICNLSYYYDFDYTEYCHIPLFLTKEPMMRKGPLYGADFASYIPTSIADQLLIKYSLENYNQLLEGHYLYSVDFGHEVYSFSINNIYLNDSSTNWKRKEEDTYYKFFGKRNKNAIMIASTNLLDTQPKTKFCFDTNPGYGNIERIIKKCNTTLGEKLDYKITNKDGHVLKYTFFTSDFKSGFYSKTQAPYYIAAILTIFVQSVLLLYSESLIKHLLRNTIALVSAYFIIGTVIEILKSSLNSTFGIFHFFNYIGAVMTLIYILILFIIYLIMSIRADKKNDKKVS